MCSFGIQIEKSSENLRLVIINLRLNAKMNRLFPGMVKFNIAMSIFKNVREEKFTNLMNMAMRITIVLVLIYAYERRLNLPSQIHSLMRMSSCSVCMSYVRLGHHDGRLLGPTTCLAHIKMEASRLVLCPRTQQQACRLVLLTVPFCGERQGGKL